LVAGLVAAQSLAGRLAADRSRVVLVTGMALIVAGLALLSTIASDTPSIVLAGYFLITGVGVGTVPLIVLTAAQNSVHANDIGAASAVITFARSTGAALGVAIFGSLFTTTFARGPDARGVDPTQPADIAALPGGVRESVLNTFAHAMGETFLWFTPLAVVGTALALLIRARSHHRPARSTTSA
jgi:hypothetical protein